MLEPFPAEAEVTDARAALFYLRNVPEIQAGPLDDSAAVERDNAHLRALRARARKVVDRHDRATRSTLLRAHHAKASHRGRRGYVSPAVELQRAQWTCIAAMVAARLLAPQVVAIAQGIDTLELHTKRPVGPYLGQRLEAAFDLAQRTKEPQRVEIGGVEFHVRPRLVKGGWLLENAGGDVVLRVRADAEPDEASVVVELHAAVLWAQGWREAGELARRLCEAVTGSDDVDLQVTRLDLCVDFQGWAVTPEDRDLFTTRAKRIAAYREGLLQPEWDDGEWIQSETARVKRLAKQLERADTPEEARRLLEVLHRPSQERATHVEYDAGRMSFTGFAFGRGGCLSARLYNKSREIRVSRKQWFRAVWAKSPDFREPPGGSVNGKVRAHFEVWRLEFQLRREALKQFTIDVGGGKWRDLTAWDDCAAHLDHLWQTLTAKWLRHGWRTADDRQAMSRAWRTLHRHRITDAGAVTQLERVIPEVAVEPTLGSVAGYLTTAAAQLIDRAQCMLEKMTSPADVEWEREQGRDGTQDFGAVMTSVLSAAFQHAESRANTTAEAIAQAKAEKIAARRAFLARRDTSREDHRRARAREARRFGTWEGIGVVRTEADDEREALARKARYERQNAAFRATVVPF